MHSDLSQLLQRT